VSFSSLGEGIKAPETTTRDDEELQWNFQRSVMHSGSGAMNTNRWRHCRTISSHQFGDDPTARHRRTDDGSATATISLARQERAPQ
jgi:hypothetical protein